MRRRRWRLSAFLAAAGLLAGGSPAPAAARVVELDVRAHDGHGDRSRGTVVCRGDRARATGFLRSRSAHRLCRRARRMAAFLDSAPTQGPCTEVYGGPQRALVSGRVGARRIHRRFARRDGCEIADWDRARALLPRLRGADSS